MLNEKKFSWSRYDEEEDNPRSLYGLPHPQHHSRPHDGVVAVQYHSDEESDEAHIDTVGDDEDVDNGDMVDDEDEDEDEDEVKVIKTPSRPSSPSSPLTAQSTPPSGRARRYTSHEFVKEQLRQKPPVHTA